MSCDVRARLAGFVLLCLLLVVGQADAQTNPSPPAGMTQQQYDELVKSVGEAVLQKLTEKGLVGKPSASPSEAKPSEVGKETLEVEQVAEAFGEVPKVLGGYSDVWTDLVQLTDRLDRTTAGARGTWAYLGLLAIMAAVALLAEVGVGRLTLTKRQVISQQFAATGGLSRVAALALLDGLAVVALWMVVNLALGTLFAKAGVQTQFAALVFKGLVTWRILMLLFRLYLRPELAAVRIAPVTDKSAHRLLRLFGFKRGNPQERKGVPVWLRKRTPICTFMSTRPS